MNLPQALSVVVYDDLEDLSAAVAQRIAQIGAWALGEHGMFRIALAGGDTPRRCYELLQGASIDWKRVEVYFGDERCLPRGDVGRNDRMAYDTLLGHIGVSPANVHAIQAERGARIAAQEYAALLREVLPLDLVLLGVGEDGHTASLFPANPATEQDEIAVPVFNAPKFPPERVSLGMNTLNAARNKLFLVSGAAKRTALRQIAQGMALPAGRVAGAEWHIERSALPDEILSKD
ncbi:MAG TPA: 6-phosphogluconolactonase [Gallionella sp.]|nr:6-phosphogluconolactonase [Gallionella sp.]